MKTSKFNSADALRMSVSLALAAGMTTAVPTAFAQDDEAAATEGRIEVTGSRIKRADIEGALPVTVIDRSAIELSGQTSVADLLRNTTFNSFGSFRPRSGSSAQSLAGLSIRGLGEGRTLILIDGRRAPVHPSTGSAQDLNTIPLAAVERIEILSDGASAIYGTDAIGGVVNVITRKDFTGAQLMAGMGRPKQLGGDTDEGSFLVGAAGDRGRVMGGASYNTRDIVFQRDRHWSVGGASTFSNNYREAFSPFAFVQDPVNGSVVPGGCGAAGFSIVETVPGDPSSQRCLYDFTSTAADEASLKNSSLFLRGDYRINDDWSTYLNASVTRLKSFGRYAPVPAFVFVPAGSPNNIYAGTANDRDLFLGHRFAALGNRDQFIESNVYDVNYGFMGRIGPVDLDIGVRRSEFKFIDLGKNYLVIPIANQFIATGEYDIFDPFGNDPSVLNSMKAVISRDSVSVVDEVYAIGNFDLPFELDGGVVGAAVGVEYREEDYADLYDHLSEGGQIGGSSGNSAALGRNVTAFFFETLFPVTPDLEVTFAGRHDKYSDYGNDFSPKLSVRYQPSDYWTLRASYGQGFKAPTLDLLSQSPSFSADFTTDPATCQALGLTVSGGQCFNAQGQPQAPQVTMFVIANPNLSSENSKQFSFGVVWDQIDWVNASIDYYNIKIEDRIAFVGLGTIISCLAGEIACPPGVSNLDPAVFNPLTFNGDPSLGLGIARDPNDGSIVFGQRGAVNRGTEETSGIDLNIRTNFAFGGWGELRNNFQFGYVNEYSIDGGPDLVDSTFDAGGLPRMRAILENVWSYGDYQVSWNINYIHSVDNLAGVPDATPSWTTHDLQVNYFTPWNGRMTFGVDNAGDKDPPLDGGLARGFDVSNYDPYGRVPYLRYTQTF